MLKNNKSIRHELLAFMLALVMIIGVIPLNVIAEQLDVKKNSIKSDIIIKNKDDSDIRLNGENEEETARQFTATFNPNGGGGQYTL